MQTAISSETLIMLHTAWRLCSTMFQISQSACQGIHDGTVALPCAVWPNVNCAVFPYIAAVCSYGKFKRRVSVSFSLLKPRTSYRFQSFAGKV